MAAKQFPTRNDLPPEARARVIDLLDQNLADLTDLYTQTKHAHCSQVEQALRITRVLCLRTYSSISVVAVNRTRGTAVASATGAG